MELIYANHLGAGLEFTETVGASLEVLIPSGAVGSSVRGNAGSALLLFALGSSLLQF